MNENYSFDFVQLVSCKQKVIRKEFKLLFYEVDTAFLPSYPRMQFRFFGFLR